MLGQVKNFAGLSQLHTELGFELGLSDSTCLFQYSISSYIRVLHINMGIQLYEGHCTLILVHAPIN